MKNVTRRIAVATAALLSLGLVTGCSGSVPKDQVESQVSQAFSKGGQKVDKVECPDDLKGEVDTEMTCKVTVGDQTRDIKVKVTKVEDKKAYFDVLPADSK